MGMFDFLKNKNDSEETIDQDNPLEKEEESSAAAGALDVSWDTLTFGTAGGVDRTDAPYIQHDRSESTSAPRQSREETVSYQHSAPISRLQRVTPAQDVPFVQTQKTVPDKDISSYRLGEDRSKSRQTNTIKETPKEIDYSNYVLPSAEVLTATAGGSREDDSLYKERLESVFENYRIKAKVMTIEQTDMAVTFGIALNAGVRVNNVTSYKEEYQVALGGRVEFEVPLKGTTYLGLHVFKENKSGVGLRKIIESATFRNSQARIPLLMGVSPSGEPVIEDLDSIGHILIGGETGSGKSVFLNSLILGMLFKKGPADLRFILIDTNILNLNAYNGIPSLLLPVITDVRKALGAISWCAYEINRRTQVMIDYACRDIDIYNAKPGVTKLPHIVLIIDEFAPILDDESGLDALLSLTSIGKPAGVHLILSTQKISSRNVLRRVKECIHARVSFSVFSEAESKQILDMSGAEKLTGSGEMVYRRPGENGLLHIQGIYTKDDDTMKTVEMIKTKNEYDYGESVVAQIEQQVIGNESNEPLYDELLRIAGQHVIVNDRASIGMLQRILKLGFNRTARIMDQLAELGVVSEEQGVRPRDVLMTLEQFESLMDELGL